MQGVEDLVTFSKIDYDATPAEETDYYLHFMAEGVLGGPEGIRFTMGKGDEDRYIVGARRYMTTPELLADISLIDHLKLINLNEKTATHVATVFAQTKVLQGQSPQAASDPRVQQLIQQQTKHYLEKLFGNNDRLHTYIRTIIVRKLMRDHQSDLQGFLHKANAAADLVQKLWFEANRD